MIAAASRRIRAFPHRIGIWGAGGRGRIGWTTTCLIEAGARLELGRGSVIQGNCLVVLNAGSTLRVGAETAVMHGGELSVGADSVLRIGSDSYVGSFANIRVDGDLSIGSNVLIAQFVSLLSGEYDHRSGVGHATTLSIQRGHTTIENGVWIGASVVVLSGVTVGQGAVIGAGSIVTRDVAPLSIVAGNPARVIGWRGRTTRLI